MAEEKFKVTECLRIIQNLFTQPKYTELKVTMEAWIKLMCYIHLVGDDEITGLGRIKDGVITDFKIPKQVVTPTTANAADDAMIELLREIPVEEIEEWELDWHSHVDMGVFMSKTDENNYELMSMARGSKQFPLMVVNKDQDVLLKNFVHKNKITDIELTLMTKELSAEEYEKIYNECKEDVLAKVTEMPKQVAKKVDKTWYQNYLAKSKKNENITEAEFTVEPKDKYNLEKQYYCRHCGNSLITADEIDAGLCEDCMNWEFGYRYGR